MADRTSNSLLPQFVLEKLLNQDQAGRRIVLQGTISGEPALLLLERGAFDTEPSHLAALPTLLNNIDPLGHNDIYRWYLASLQPDHSLGRPPPDVKINLIYPCTEKHVQKYSFQQVRVVVESPETYRRYVRPYMHRCRQEGRLNWVFNILEGRSEQENVLYRSQETSKQDDFLLLPDLNWDRKTVGSLHMLALVERRDLWSLRDLSKKDVPWLRRLRTTLVDQVVNMYDGVEVDMLKFYVHYQPTYYHFHIHIVNVSLDPNATQAVGKALGFDNVISQLETMSGGEASGMADVELAYTLGEASELWQQVFRQLKEGKEPLSTD